MTRPEKDSRRWCDHKGCDTRLIFARRAGTDRHVPLEADDRVPFSQEALGCLVYVAGEAWKPGDLIEHFQTRFEVSENSARALVSGYAFHRPHYHEPPTEPETDQ